jgi:hypothetical protein
MLWRIADDEQEEEGGSMAATRLAGFDLAEPTARNQGKPAAIRLIRRRNPYSTVVMVGDGITDLEVRERVCVWRERRVFLVLLAFLAGQRERKRGARARALPPPF